MKRLLPVLLIAVAIAALVFRDKWLPAAPGQNAWLGAVDARLTLLGPLAAGRIAAVKIEKGAAIKAGDILFTLDDGLAKAQQSQAAAALVTAQENLRDLQSGKRSEEIAVFDQQLAEANANLLLAQQNYLRADSLNNKGISAQAQFDSAKAAAEVAQTHINQIAANRKVAELPTREAMVAAAQSRVNEAKAALQQASTHVEDFDIYAPANATVNDVFFAAGEVVGAGQPVVALLPPDALVLRFFVPELARVKLATGSEVNFSCDHCATALKAKVTHIFATPEYTPPVIYSENARGKLVFQVEAKIVGIHPELQPGQPVQVEPLQ